MTYNNKPINKEQLPAEITTIDQLAQSLAIHTRFISDEIIMPALKKNKLPGTIDLNPSEGHLINPISPTAPAL